MSLAVANLSRWPWSGKQKEGIRQNGSIPVSITELLHLLDLDSLKFPLIVGSSTASKSRRVSRKLQAREKRVVDREYDGVLVPSHGGCIFESDSDTSDWSIGWSEPHAPGFLSDNETDGGFGVLVPCYGSKNRDVAEVTIKSRARVSDALDCWRGNSGGGLGGSMSHRSSCW